MKRLIYIVGVAILAAGCARFSVAPAIPEGYSGPTALVKDSAKLYEDSLNPQFVKKADFFFVDKVDTRDIDDSPRASRTANHGLGLYFRRMIVVEREIPAQQTTLLLVGRTTYAAPIWEYGNPVYEVSGHLTFEPEHDRTYVVKGELSEHYSVVWLEDEGTGEIVGSKMELRTSPD